MGQDMSHSPKLLQDFSIRSLPPNASEAFFAPGPSLLPWSDRIGLVGSAPLRIAHIAPLAVGPALGIHQLEMTREGGGWGEGGAW